MQNFCTIFWFNQKKLQITLTKTNQGNLSNNFQGLDRIPAVSVKHTCSTDWKDEKNFKNSPEVISYPDFGEAFSVLCGTGELRLLYYSRKIKARKLAVKCCASRILSYTEENHFYSRNLQLIDLKWVLNKTNRDYPYHNPYQKSLTIHIINHKVRLSVFSEFNWSVKYWFWLDIKIGYPLEICEDYIKNYTEFINLSSAHKKCYKNNK